MKRGMDISLKGSDVVSGSSSSKSAVLWEPRDNTTVFCSIGIILSDQIHLSNPKFQKLTHTEKQRRENLLRVMGRKNIAGKGDNTDQLKRK